MGLRQVNYLRLSESDEASTSIERQRADLNTYAEREGHTVVAELVDDGVSGRKARAKAAEALAMLADGRADVLAVWKLDRFGRRGVRDVADLQDVLDGRPGALFVAVQDGQRSDAPAWDMMVGVLTGIGRMESNNIRTRVKSTINHLRTVEGRFSGGAVPYGYRPAPNPSGAGRVLVLDAAEVDVISELADRALAGESLFRLARELTERGVPAPASEARRFAIAGRPAAEARRGRWSANTVRRLLTDDVIRGRVRHRGAVLTGPDGMPREVWPPALDGDRWAALRGKLLPDPDRPTVQRQRSAVLLSGIARCECGQRLVFHRQSGTMRCPAKARGYDCDGLAIAYAALEAYTLGRVLAALGDVDETRWETHASGSSVAELADVERAISETAAGMAADDADVSVLAARLAELKARRATLRAAPPVRETVAVTTGRTYREALSAGTEDARRAVLAGIVPTVTVRRAERKGQRFDGDARVALDWFTLAPAEAETMAVVHRVLESRSRGEIIPGVPMPRPSEA